MNDHKNRHNFTLIANEETPARTHVLLSLSLLYHNNTTTSKMIILPSPLMYKRV